MKPEDKSSPMLDYIYKVMPFCDAENKDELEEVLALFFEDGDDNHLFRGISNVYLSGLEQGHRESVLEAVNSGDISLFVESLSPEVKKILFGD